MGHSTVLSSQMDHAIAPSLTHLTGSRSKFDGSLHSTVSLNELCYSTVTYLLNRSWLKSDELLNSTFSLDKLLHNATPYLID